MHPIHKSIKYVLWTFFAIIVFILLIWLAKMNRKVSSYVSFLNSTDWRSFSISTLRPSNTTGSITDILSGTTVQSGTSGLNVYDPTFESDLNNLSGEDISNGGDTQEVGFGFVQDTSSWSNVSDTPTNDASGASSKEQLLNLIKQHELNK